MSKSQKNGADFVIWGTVSSKVPKDPSGDTVRISYTVGLALLNLTTKRNAWVAKKEIKKTVVRSKLNR